MRFQIRRETESKCDQCSYALRVTDGDGHLVITRCTVGGDQPFDVPRVVRECSRFDFKWTGDAWEYKDRAWVMEVSASKREFIGFRPPKKGDDGK